MKAISLRGIREIQDGMPLPDEVMALDTESAEVAMSAIVRSHRSRLLRDTDWTQISDNNLDATQRAAFAVYRRALRDIPDQAGFPHVTWPQPPALQAGAGTETGEQS